MKTVAIVLAGGTGSRMHSVQPKQFIDIDGIPIIVRNLMNFQKSPLIDKVLIVCIKDWVQQMKELVGQFSLDKVSWIIEGGSTGHDSTRNAIFFLRDKLCDDDFVVIHDAARPILPQKIINNLLDVALENGNACASLPCHETIVVTDNQKDGNSEIDRSHIRRIQTPQAYRFGLIYPIYQKAEADGRHDFIYANTCAIHYGLRIYFSEGFDNNIKITTKEDIALYESLLTFPEEDLVK
jgi:2-C-methyl-D-erythritol 4-phosphate cytidylyltransferase